MSLRAGRVRGCLNIAPRAVPVRALTPPGTVDPPEPLFSEAMIQAKGTYGRARPNPAQVVLAAQMAARPHLGGARGGVRCAAGDRPSPDRARVARLRGARAALAADRCDPGLGRAFFPPLAVATVCLMLYQFIRDKLEEFVPA